MDTDIKSSVGRLIDLGYEIEGLLRVIDSRSGVTPDEVWTLLQEKVSALCDGVHALAPDTSVSENAAEVCVVLESGNPAVDEDIIVMTDENAQPVENAEPEENEASDELPVSTLRLDEKLARDSYRNLRKAFSLNDRFRFRRELFGNSEIEMSDTLNLIEAMTSYDEAVEYFVTDLQWDADAPEVKDFMSIIGKHFSAR